MENTIIIAIVSFLCILAHVPTLILRIVPFHEKISDKDRIRLTVIYAIGLAVDFGICMWVGNYREIDVPFYKINLIAFCIVMAAVNIWLVPGLLKLLRRILLMEYYSRKMGKFTQKNGKTNRKESAFFP